MLALDTNQVGRTNFKKVAGVVTVATSLAVAGLVVTTQTSSKKEKLALITIPQEFSGHFTLQHDDGSYRVDGKIHKFEHEDGDWQIDGFFTAKGLGLSKTKYHEYTLKDDILIEDARNLTNSERIQVQCLEPAGFLQYGRAKALLQNAVVVGEEQMHEDLLKKSQATCPNGSELAYVQDVLMPWIVCGDYSDGNFVMHAIGQRGTAYVTAVEGMVVDVDYPEGFNPENCTKGDPLVSWSDRLIRGPSYEERVLAPSTDYGAWPFKVDEHEGRKLGNYAIPQYNNSCDGIRKCIINHGVANAGMNRWDGGLPSSQNPRYPELRDEMSNPGSNYLSNYDADNDYPRPLELCYRHRGKCNKEGSAYGMTNFDWRVVENCDYLYIPDAETQNRGYDNETLVQEFADVWRNSGYDNASCSGNMYWMTHSMSGLVMQKGLINGTIQRHNLWWYQCQNPWYGSNAANKNAFTCGLLRALQSISALALGVICGIIIVGVLAGPAGLTAAVMAAYGMSPALVAFITASFGLTAGVVAGAAFAAAMWALGIALVLLAATRLAAGASLVDAEICIVGQHKIPAGVPGLPYGLPANESISYRVPWVQTGIKTPFNNAKRRPNYRICGNFPHGPNTDFDRSMSFKQTAKFNEHVSTRTIGNKDVQAAIIASWWTEYKWGDVQSFTQDEDPEFNNGSFWNDGCVDATNCMNYALYSYSASGVGWLRESRVWVTPDNHDSGTCRAGWHQSGYNSACNHALRFFRNKRSNEAMPQYAGQGASYFFQGRW